MVISIPVGPMTTLTPPTMNGPAIAEQPTSARMPFASSTGAVTTVRT
ncbi:hypothetical protein [Streptomyces sp. AB3(2024)]